ncbi:MAG TPA: hypothetical protein ENN33_07590 [Ignavibacteria bacterium]|nr:hypothetical protein [Ignavibacteria bacterium]
MQEDIQLIKQAQKGDQLAFEQLVYRYDRQVLNIAMSFRNNEDDAQDIYQEVFLRVFRGLKISNSKVNFQPGFLELQLMYVSHIKHKRNETDINHSTNR